MVTGRNPLTILHVEDDADLALMVQLTVAELGFEGEWIRASDVQQTLKLLSQKEQNRERINLILVDIELPDGTGLDVIRVLKASVWWRLTPVIVLSSNAETSVVNAAYALGASFFLRKCPESSTLSETLEALHRCWSGAAVWPHPETIDRLQFAIARAVKTRARAAELYLSGARALAATSDAAFWLDRSLKEGNISNLMAFLAPLVTERAVPAGLVERLSVMQARVEAALQQAELRLQAGVPSRPEELCTLAMQITKPLDEGIVTELLGCIFTLTPQAVSVFKENIAMQLDELGRYTLERMQDADLRRHATRLQEWAAKMR